MMRTLDDLGRHGLAGRVVFLRVDFNVPLDGERVVDDTRLREALPTIRELSGAGARLLLASHCGRPKGKRAPKDSLRPAAKRLGELLAAPVAFADDCIGETAAAAAGVLAPGQVCLLENLRYHAGEEANEAEFAAALAANAEIYVDDAFGAAHRAHASIVGVPERLPPARTAAGRLLVREVEALSRLLGTPQKPFAAVLGGAKIEDKIDTLENLLPRLDLLIVGGGMANTFLVAQGMDLRSSLYEPDRLELARSILARAGDQGTNVLLPVDLVATDDLAAPTRIEVVAADAVPAGLKAVDVGPETRKLFSAAIASARTLFWNGPLGVFEKPPFAAGTREVAKAIGACSGFTVAGGGETIAAARAAGVAGQLDHVSTGGGASLEFLAGKILPGVEVLERQA